MNEKEMLESLKEEVDCCLKKIRESLFRSTNIGNGRPHEYEHNHFMLVEAVANYIIQLEEYNSYKQKVENKDI